eukprot:CAMPEP_0116875460 /NCGR_PEP_ID=MMETSP0463-20121206/7426_1 /TAXON_ID=181622 /ORGANISM="Strombidinopsis sp, Strain SopsisLIS2011" /LENGTH=77 /DNA_ID=CAMNT_0004521135 /DNA_START=822 /DNA_END=1055 /DNA_ORIENTATION=-
MPKDIKIGPATETVGYLASGEASDWIVASFGIPAVSPELGNTDEKSRTFKLASLDLTMDILEESYSYVQTTFNKLSD